MEKHRKETNSSKSKRTVKITNFFLIYNAFSSVAYAHPFMFSLRYLCKQVSFQQTLTNFVDKHKNH